MSKETQGFCQWINGYQNTPPDPTDPDWMELIFKFWWVAVGLGALYFLF